MKKILSMLTLSLLFSGCPDMTEKTELNEFEICTVVNNVNIDDGVKEARVILMASANGNSQSVEVLADININHQERACGGKFKGENNKLKALTVTQIQSVILIDKNGKNIYGSGQLPWDEKIIEVKFDGFYKKPPSDAGEQPLAFYLKALNKFSKKSVSKLPNNSHLIKEENKIQESKKASSSQSVQI